MMELAEHIRLHELEKHLEQPIRLSPNRLEKVARNREYLEQRIAREEVHYGINTGFGSLCDRRISSEDLARLQENLVRSHACGMGPELPLPLVRIMLLLKIHALCQGQSGVRPVIVERLTDFYNHEVYPVIYEQGSLGASGDLAPLAHLTLPVFGQGWVYYRGEKRPSQEVLAEKGWEPIPLSAKEGLALLNGTQFMNAYAAWALMEADRLLDWSDHIAALSLDVFQGRYDPFYAPIHALRPHPGQQKTAARLLEILQDSALGAMPKEQVQDPYSFRCIPQVHGASRDALDYARRVVEIEMNAVTDNPLVFHEEGRIVSGGNFHGQPLALQLDFMAIALSELGNISERRTYLLISGQRGLPAFLSPSPGLNSGLMIAQYTAAAIVSQNKQLSTPASVDSIVSSNGQEDHVSMGANAATKLYRVVDNLRRVLSIEWLTAAQGLDFRRPARTAYALETLWERFRDQVPFMEEDRLLRDDLEKAEAFLRKSPGEHLRA